MTRRKCVHHWKIDEPHGTAEVGAVCRKCGARRKFRAGWRDLGGWREEFEERLEQCSRTT